VRRAASIASHAAGTRPLSAACYCVTERHGDLVVTADWAGELRVWRQTHGSDAPATLLATLPLHEGRVSAARFRAGLLTTASADGTAVVCELRDTGFERVATLVAHRARVTDARVCPVRRSMVATAALDGDLCLWDGDVCVLRQHTGHCGGVFALAFHHDGGLLASAGCDAALRLWDMRSGRAVRTLPNAHADALTAAHFVPRASWLVSAGKDHCVRVWDVRTMRVLYTVAAHANVVSDLALDEHGHVLFSAGFDCCVKAWALQRECALVACWPRFDDKILALACRPDASRVVAACYDKTWRLWGCPTRPPPPDHSA
ncbi:unnamed protein product, partial [Agarophyton chilense]